MRPLPNPSTSLPAAAGARMRAFGRTTGALSVLALLAACSSTPLPHWPDPTKEQRIPPPRPAVVIPTMPPPPVTTTPVAPNVLPPGSALESPAITAHFPPPQQTYDTPGLHAQRQTFTTQPELLQWLDREAVAAQERGMHAGVLRLGHTAQGDVLAALVLTRAQGLEPAQLDESRRPTVLLVGQQNPQDAASAEALLVVARELARGSLSGLLEQINVILLPRTTTGPVRPEPVSDHLNLRTPEARAIATLLRDYRPMVVLDLQEYATGDALRERTQSVRGQDALLQTSSVPNAHEFLLKSAHEWFVPAVQEALNQQGLRSDWDQIVGDDPSQVQVASGWMGAQYLHNSAALRNAVGLVVRGRGADLGRAHLQRRVHTLVTATQAVLQTTASRAPSLEQVRSFVSREVASQACTGRLVVSAQPTAQVRTLELLDPSTGQPRPVRVQGLSAQQLSPLNTRQRPCGYWVSAQASETTERLRQFGLPTLKVAESGSMMAERFEPGGNYGATLQPTRSAMLAPSGSYYVSLNQPLAFLASAVLEADAPGSFFRQELLGSVNDVARIVTTPSVIFEETE